MAHWVVLAVVLGLILGVGCIGYVEREARDTRSPQEVYDDVIAWRDVVPPPKVVAPPPPVLWDFCASCAHVHRREDFAWVDGWYRCSECRQHNHLHA